MEEETVSKFNKNTSIAQIKVVKSESSNIRIHDRRIFKSNVSKDKESLEKLKNSKKQEAATEGLKIVIKKPNSKQKEDKYARALKDFMIKVEDKFLALVVMNADPTRVGNGLKKLSEKAAEEN